MTNEERSFLLELSKSIKSQLEIQDRLITRLLHEDRYMTLQEVKDLIPGITAHKLNDLSRAGHLTIKKLGPRNTLYLESSLRRMFPSSFPEIPAGQPPTPIQ